LLFEPVDRAHRFGASAAPRVSTVWAVAGLAKFFCARRRVWATGKPIPGTCYGVHGRFARFPNQARRHGEERLPLASNTAWHRPCEGHRRELRVVRTPRRSRESSVRDVPFAAPRRPPAAAFAFRAVPI